MNAVVKNIGALSRAFYDWFRTQHGNKESGKTQASNYKKIANEAWGASALYLLQRLIKINLGTAQLNNIFMKYARTSPAKGIPESEFPAMADEIFRMTVQDTFAAESILVRHFEPPEPERYWLQFSHVMPWEEADSYNSTNIRYFVQCKDGRLELAYFDTNACVFILDNYYHKDDRWSRNGGEEEEDPGGDDVILWMRIPAYEERY